MRPFEVPLVLPLLCGGGLFVSYHWLHVSVGATPGSLQLYHIATFRTGTRCSLELAYMSS